jgi:hypothetical protein
MVCFTHFLNFLLLYILKTFCQSLCVLQWSKQKTLQSGRAFVQRLPHELLSPRRRLLFLSF